MRTLIGRIDNLSSAFFFGPRLERFWMFTVWVRKYLMEVSKGAKREMLFFFLTSERYGILMIMLHSMSLWFMMTPLLSSLKYRASRYVQKSILSTVPLSHFRSSTLKIWQSFFQDAPYLESEINLIIRQTFKWSWISNFYKLTKKKIFREISIFKPFLISLT